MADAASLKDVPSDFGEYFLPYKPCLRQRIQARKFSNESYISKLQLFHGRDGDIDVKSVVFRSQRKNDDGHMVNMSIGRSCVSNAICSCKAG
ncbi:hypothetical protein DPMN_132307 [Dreissena polymorpha]|uniref:Uncharacterized protein n=2 Tax=Dreissena polymorpha TaxID=45954 RepID=A0A9D4FTK6_DREPO|nr:hypothetical protein DPMN_132307 [Dreissena polymorpha]